MQAFLSAMFLLLESLASEKILPWRTPTVPKISTLKELTSSNSEQSWWLAKKEYCARVINPMTSAWPESSLELADTNQPSCLTSNRHKAPEGRLLCSARCSVRWTRSLEPLKSAIYSRLHRHLATR